MKKNNKLNFIMILFFFIGLAILFYPAISNYTNEKLQSKTIDKYVNLLSKQEDYTEEFKIAEEYNKELLKLNSPLINYKKIGDTTNILNTNDIGMIGYLSIEKIKVELPIYYGTKVETLNTAVGLLEGTSYPIGGLGTHAVLAGHRGLPSSKLFTDLDELEIGDTFVITVLDRTLTYEVDKITIIKPDEVEDIKIDENNDYVTLMTCTPYGINTHRLLVRGKRTTNKKTKVYIGNEAYQINKMIVTPIICIPLLIMWLILIVISGNEKKNKDYKMKYLYPTEYKKNHIGGKK